MRPDWGCGGVSQRALCRRTAWRCCTGAAWFAGPRTGACTRKCTCTRKRRSTDASTYLGLESRSPRVHQARWDGSRCQRVAALAALRPGDKAITNACCGFASSSLNAMRDGARTRSAASPVTTVRDRGLARAACDRLAGRCTAAACPSLLAGNLQLCSTVVPQHSHAGWCLHQCWLLAAGLRWCLCIANGLIVMLVTKRGPAQLALRAQLHPQDQFCMR